jgi:hypothetical protein
MTQARCEKRATPPAKGSRALLPAQKPSDYRVAEAEKEAGWESPVRSGNNSSYESIYFLFAEDYYTLRTRMAPRQVGIGCCAGKEIAQAGAASPFCGREMPRSTTE